MRCLAGIIGACVSLALDSLYFNPGSKGMRNWIGLRLKRPAEMAPTVDRPVDLGYFIGYRIAQAYFEQASDRPSALQVPLLGRNDESIIRESGYAERMSP